MTSIPGTGTGTGILVIVFDTAIPPHQQALHMIEGAPCVLPRLVLWRSPPPLFVEQPGAVELPVLSLAVVSGCPTWQTGGESAEIQVQNGGDTDNCNSMLSSRWKVNSGNLTTTTTTTNHRDDIYMLQICTMVSTNRFAIVLPKYWNQLQSSRNAAATLLWQLDTTHLCCGNLAFG